MYETEKALKFIAPEFSSTYLTYAFYLLVVGLIGAIIYIILTYKNGLFQEIMGTKIKRFSKTKN